MVWDPKDPWSKGDKFDDAFKQAQGQLRELLPSGGLKNVILVVVAIFLIWQSAFIIAPDEEGVVKRFGVPVRTVSPGPHLKIPLLESVLQPKVAKLHRVEVGFRKDRQGRQQMIPQEALMLTGDMNILAIEFIVQYKIKNSSQYLFNVAYIDETIVKAAEAAMREVIGRVRSMKRSPPGRPLSSRIPKNCCNRSSINTRPGTSGRCPDARRRSARGRSRRLQGCDERQRRPGKIDQSIAGVP